MGTGPLDPCRARPSATPRASRPNHLRWLRLVGEAQDVGRVALVIGDDEVPVARLGGRRRHVDFELVHAVGIVRLEAPHPAGRGHGEGAPRRGVNASTWGPRSPLGSETSSLMIAALPFRVSLGTNSTRLMTGSFALVGSGTSTTSTSSVAPVSTLTAFGL